jgi:hypothetical protein
MEIRTCGNEEYQYFEQKRVSPGNYKVQVCYYINKEQKECIEKEFIIE